MKKQIFLFFLINLIILELVGFFLPLSAGLHLGLMLAVAVCATLIFTFFVWRFSKKLALIQKKVHQINVANDDTHLILPNDDPLHGLTHELNQLQSHIKHQSHRTLRQENERETLVKHLPIGVMVIDRYGQVQVANDVIQELFQHEFDPIPHAYQQDIVQPELLTMVNAAMQRQKSGQRLITFDTPQNRKNIRVQVLYSEIRPKHFQVTVLLTDVSDLVAMSKMQSDFVANASHELKTPITAISGFSETLLEQPTDEKTREKFLTIIKQESDKLVKLIDDILSLSRLRDDQPGDLKLQQIHLADFVSDQLDDHQASAQLKSVKLENNVPADLIVTSDEGRLRGILYNLLANAIKYNDDGGHVTVAATSTFAGWQLSVSDNGIGIPTNQQQRIFERFYRGDNGKTIPGTGLGLAIVAEQAAQLSGSINVTSELGVGTTIKIDFPNDN